MRHYSSCVVYDKDDNRHDVDIYTTSYKWNVRLRAVRRECERLGIEIGYAFIGGNFWSRNELLTA